MPLKKQRTPQEKKRLSLERDRRNVYGENDKSSRVAIHQRKRQKNRAYRTKIRSLLNGIGSRLMAGSDNEIDPVESRINSTHRNDWQKSPDVPLGEFVARQLQQRALRQQYGRHFKDVVGSDREKWPHPVPPTDESATK